MVGEEVLVVLLVNQLGQAIANEVEAAEEGERTDLGNKGYHSEFIKDHPFEASLVGFRSIELVVSPLYVAKHATLLLNCFLSQVS